MPTLVLIPAIGPPELLPPGTHPVDVFQQVPLLAHHLSDGTKLFWLHSASRHQHVNAYGTRAAGFAVRGDVCALYSDLVSDVEAFFQRFQRVSRVDAYLQRSARARRRGNSEALGQASNLGTRCAKHAFPPKRARNEDPEGNGADKNCRQPSAAGAGPVLFESERGPLGVSRPISSFNPTSPTHAHGWSCLPTDLFCSILSHVATGMDLVSVSGACSTWRQMALEEKCHLKRLDFGIDVAAPFVDRSKRFTAHHCERLPAVFNKDGQPSKAVCQSALNLDNVSALRCFGMLLDEAGLGIRSLNIWKRLLSLGDVYGCWKMGEILYEGRDYVPMNQTAAFHALSRAGRKAKSMDEGPERSEILARVGIYLGYCFLDGDAGQKEDNEKAIAWFRLAAAHGNEDAQRVCGWIFNTGMYG